MQLQQQCVADGERLVMTRLHFPVGVWVGVMACRWRKHSARLGRSQRDQGLAFSSRVTTGRPLEGEEEEGERERREGGGGGEGEGEKGGRRRGRGRGGREAEGERGHQVGWGGRGCALAESHRIQFPLGPHSLNNFGQVVLSPCLSFRIGQRRSGAEINKGTGGS